MRYSVTEDKRNNLECYLYLISCIICVGLEVFLLSKITFPNLIINTLWILLQCAITVSPFLFVWLIKKLFWKFFLKLCGIKNLSGTYEVEIQSNYKKRKTSHAILEIKQNLDTIKIYFNADKSKSYAINAKIENTNLYPILYYTYNNEGDGADNHNNTHIGTAVLTFFENKIDGYYYNNGKDRRTYGTIKSVEK